MKTWLLVISLFCSQLLHGNDAEWERYKRNVLKHQHKVMGWCKLEKAEKMMDLIRIVQPEICVEIGVFGGASIYPTASALKYCNKGKVFGIDPWTPEASIEGFDPDLANHVWWSMLDYQQVFEHYGNMLRSFKLNPYVETFKTTSAGALHNFKDDSIDILHVDGNHSEDSSYFDVVHYLPKVRSGGYIWFDDADWHQTSKALSYMCENAELLDEYTIGNRECVLFQKP